MEFSEKTVMVTGASVGIGLATAALFAREGARVAMLDRDEPRLLARAAELSSQGFPVLPLVCDVSDETRVKECVALIDEKWRKIDILVNNAGIWRRYIPFVETTSDMWKHYIDVNILGTMYCTHAVLPGMLQAGWGRIINVASIAGVIGNANMADYSMTKGALISFTKALAKEVADKGITVNCISPGSVSNEQDVVAPSELSFMGRTGTHTENAEAIAFFASDRAAYISGENLRVDGCRKRM